MSRRQFREVMTRVTQLSARRRLSRAADLQMQLYAPGEVPPVADLHEPRTEVGKPKAAAEMQRHALSIWEDENGASHLRAAKSCKGLN